MFLLINTVLLKSEIKFKELLFCCVFLTGSMISTHSNSEEHQIYQIDNDGWTVWVNCSLRSPTVFHYLTQPDNGNFARRSEYLMDPRLPQDCQARITDSFQSILGDEEIRYDVGHLVPANHMDHSRLSIFQTNYWSNLTPQSASMNRGAWLSTEEIIECYRDFVDLEVWGGAIWAGNFSTSYFTDSHRVLTPTAFWKVIIRLDTRESMAWIIPNDFAPRSSLDQWIQSIASIEAVTGLVFDIDDKVSPPLRSWMIEANCDKS